MIDVLAIGVAQKKGPTLEEHLQLMQAGLSSLRSQ
jgi:RpiR family transcriptional regulator, carbohydrate utilization regulator